MTTWDISLGRWALPIKVRQIFSQKPKFMVIVDTRGNQHKLSEEDFTPTDWANIKPGSTITLIIKASVMTWRIKPPKVEKSVSKFILEVQKKISGLFFVWVCEHCGTKGYIEYEDGDENQIIAEHILSAHQKEVKPGCVQDIFIYDHRGMRREECERFLSARRVA